MLNIKVYDLLYCKESIQNFFDLLYHNFVKYLEESFRRKSKPCSAKTCYEPFLN